MPTKRPSRPARNWWRDYAIALTAANLVYVVACVRLVAQVHHDLHHT